MILNENKQILLVKNKKRGWEFPGGYVDHGETLEEAAVREVKEETGIDIRVTRFLGLEHHVHKLTLISLFEAVPIGGVLTKSSETFDSGFYSPDTTRQMMTLTLYTERINRCLNPVMTPFITYHKYPINE